MNRKKVQGLVMAAIGGMILLANAVACQTLWDPKYHEKGQRKTIDRNLFVKINVIHFNENEKRDSAA